MDLDTITLPDGIHAAIVTGRDVVTGEPLAYPVVWADRSYGTCPRCGQPVSRVVAPCPVGLNPGAGHGGRIEEYRQQHGCGEDLGVDWDQVPAGDPQADVTAADLLAAAAALHDRRSARIRDRRDRIRRRLRSDLQDALARLAEPLETDETPDDRAEHVRTGSGTDPGVYRESPGHWVAWDYDPDGSGDTVAVTESDLVAGPAGA